MILVIKDGNYWHKGSNDDVIIPVTYPTLPSQKPLLTLITIPSTNGSSNNIDDDDDDDDDGGDNDDDDDDVVLIILLI